MPHAHRRAVVRRHAAVSDATRTAAAAARSSESESGGSLARPQPALEARRFIVAAAWRSLWSTLGGMKCRPALLCVATSIVASITAIPAPAATLPPGFTERLIAGGLSNPTAMAIAPDGRVFICQQGGQLRVVKDGSLLAAPFVAGFATGVASPVDLNVSDDGRRVEDETVAGANLVVSVLKAPQGARAGGTLTVTDTTGNEGAGGATLTRTGICSSSRRRTVATITSRR